MEAHTAPAEIVDAELADDEAHTDRAERSVAIVPAAAPALAVAPQVNPLELVERLDAIKTAAADAMTAGVDYGNVPGTDKPTLFKPGAEKLGVLFQLDVQIAVDRTWGPGDHLTAVAYATVYHAPSGARLGSGEGVCSTRERKYGIRKSNLTCPDCGAAAVLKSKHEPGFFCWRKRDGCGNNFAADDARITGQEVGEIENPDLPDTWNTIVKMARKRARVDAVLATTGASAIFTQDVEDQAGQDATAPGTGPAPAAEILEANAEQKDAASKALTALIGNADVAREAWGAIKTANAGAMPAPIAKAIALVREYKVNGPPAQAPLPESDLPADTADLPSAADAAAGR